MLCLQSITTPALSFVVLDPFVLCPSYAPSLQKAELNLFGVEDVQAPSRPNNSIGVVSSTAESLLAAVAATNSLRRMGTSWGAEMASQNKP